MHIRFLLLISLFSGFNLFAQKERPVKWTFEVTKISDSEVEFKAIADMQKSWVIYSQFTEVDGPIPTTFFIDEKEEKLTEKSEIITEYDELFGVNVSKIKNQAVFVKNYNSSGTRNLKGYVTYMTCDGERCLPPVDVPFDVKW
ncbi:MAG: hypothetical protein IPM42_08390 [Saprospiraceae bacterium]|nr:hypothetical protein [Saprospiraceae bacterium]